MLWWALMKGYGSGTLRKHPRSIVRITAERSMPDFWLAPIYIYHNIIAVHMYGILFCIPIIYLIFPQILQFTRILSIYPDIVLTTLHILSLYIYIYIYSEDPIYSRSRRERREPLTGEAPAQRHASLGPSLCASSQVPDGQGCLLSPIHSSCRVVSWDFMEIYGDLMGFYGGLMEFYGNLWWFHGI